MNQPQERANAHQLAQSLDHSPSRRQVIATAGAAAASLAVAQLALGQATQPTTRPKAKPPEMPNVDKADTPLKILILGGTGFIGPHEVQYARARGHTLTIANRGRTRPEIFEGLEIEHIELDRESEPTELRKAVEAGKKWDVVIDNSGYVPAHVTASAEAVKDAAKQYLFVSTVSVYKPQTEQGADEDWPKEEVSDEQAAKVTKMREVGPLYGALKRRCEVAAETAMPGRTTIVRPGLIVGPGDPTDRFTYWPARVLMEERCGGQMLVAGTREEPAAVQVIDVRDLASLIIALAESNTPGEFNAVGPTETLTKVVDTAKQYSGAKTEFVFVPMKFLQENNVAFWQELPMVVPAEGDYTGFATTSNERARKAGLTPRPIEETTQATIDWWKTLTPERRAMIESERSPAIKASREQDLLDKWQRQPEKSE